MKYWLMLIALGVMLSGAPRALAADRTPPAPTSSGEEIQPGPYGINDAYDIEPSTSKGPYYYLSENELRTRKFFRGVGNVVLCPAEIPNQMFRQAYQTSPVTGIFVGAGKGVIKGCKRLLIGTWEMVTFYHPGKNHYQPYVEPEVVFQEYMN